MKTKIILPKKLKREISKFYKEFEFLSSGKRMKVTIPKQEFYVDISWESDNSATINDERIFDFPDTSDLAYKSKECLQFNKKIKYFIQRTEKFGRKNFKDKDWLWENVLWECDPNCGNTYDFYKDVKWI